MKISVGVDIGGTNTVVGLVNENGEIFEKDALKTKDYTQVEDFVQALKNVILALTGKNQDFEMQGIGIGAPNGNFYTGSIEMAPNLTWKGKVPLAEMVNRELHVPVWLTNDANAAALGEMLYGGAKNMKDFIFITLGTGVGSGIVCNGNLVYGHDGFAGELGHTIVIEDGRLCGCGRKGCLEAYTSATGITHTARELLEKKNASSVLSSIDANKLDSKAIYDAAKNGDKIALECFQITSSILGKAFANAVAFTSPEAIFIFGGLAKAHDLLLNPIKQVMEANLLNIYKDKVKILPSELDDNDAAILGASALVWNEL